MEYRSKFSQLGLPPMHIATAELNNGRLKRGIARGWIAIGDIAFGIIFSAGAVAIGGIAVGGVAVEGVAMGGLVLAVAGEYAMGGLAIAPHVDGKMTTKYFETSSFFLAPSEPLPPPAAGFWFLPLTLPSKACGDGKKRSSTSSRSNFSIL